MGVALARARSVLIVVAAPATTNGHFDNAPASGSTFASVFDTWYGTTFTDL
mgnify:CR=1 FL=1